MPLSAGTRLGPYEILALVGVGGMGEVYRARDPRMGREVAIKVSAERFSDRFSREVHAVAALNHQNICHLYDVGPDYLVMELVEGEAPKGPLPLEEALRIGKQIADALEAAHEKGIVHRDLKPGNIKIRPDGTAKVLDFGLAKVVPPASAGDSENSPTLTMGMTQAGAILGTAAYMSPEQARGKNVDKRADIWAFGVVLYELITGRRLFDGEDISEILAKVIQAEPRWDGVPMKVQRLLKKCLEKDPKRRLRDIGDAWDLLEETPPVVSQVVSPRRWLWPSLAALLVLTTAALAFLQWRRGPQLDGGPVARLTIELAPAEEISPDRFGRPSRTAMAIAPDGNTVVFGGFDPEPAAPAPPKLYKRTLDQLESVPIPGTEGAIGPFFRPDGQWVGFWADGKLKKVSLSGGPAFPICDAPTPGTLGLWGASWSSTDTIVFALPAGDLMQVQAKGGTPQVFMKRDSVKGELFSTPEFLPDGKTLLYTVRTSDNWAEAQIVARRLDTGEQRVLVQGGADARYVSTGYLLYMQNAVLMAVPFDAGSLKLAGPPVAMLDGVMQTVNAPNRFFETGMGQFAVSASGNLIYAAGGIYPPSITTLLRVDRNGKETEVSGPKGGYIGPRVSPDGHRLAVVKLSETSRLSDIWVLDLLTGNGTRLTSQRANTWPIWSPDGKSLLFRGGPGSTQILSIAPDGSGAAETVLTAKGSVLPASWSVDGKLAYLENHEGKYQILTRPMSRSDAPEPFSDSKFSFEDAQFSPDGRWMAYASDETGRSEVYVRPFPGPGEKFPISVGGGEASMWARNGRELFFLARSPAGKMGMMAVDITPGAAFKHGQPHRIFEGDYQTTTPMRDYDVTSDGQFIMIRTEPPPDQRVTKLTVVLNWFDELKKRAPRTPQ